MKTLFLLIAFFTPQLAFAQCMDALCLYPPNLDRRQIVTNSGRMERVKIRNNNRVQIQVGLINIAQGQRDTEGSTQTASTGDLAGGNRDSNLIGGLLGRNRRASRRSRRR